MEKIDVTIDIAAPLAAVREAITTTAGHRAWWTPHCEVGRRPGELALFRFPSAAGDQGMNVVFRVDRSDEAGLAWTCIADHDNPQWRDTTLAIRLTGTAQGTRVDLEHARWRERTPLYDLCTGGWHHFMASLKRYLETGAGTPFAG